MASPLIWKSLLVPSPPSLLPELLDWLALSRQKEEWMVGVKLDTSHFEVINEEVSFLSVNDEKTYVEFSTLEIGL